MADKNPYRSNDKGGRRGAHFAPEPTAVVPVRRRRPGRLIAFVLIMALLGGAGFVAWQRYGGDIPSMLGKLGIGKKSVSITLNGAEVNVPEGSTVQDVFDSQKPAVTPGNLLSVTGAVLEQGAGDPYSATLNDQQVLVAQAAGTTVSEGATLTFADGQDTTEEFVSETVVGVEPKLVRKVKAGTVESDSVQTGTVQYVYQWGKQGSKEVQTGKVSGERVDANVVESQDCIIMCQNIQPDNGEKLVALTFDDGPFASTPAVLDVLARYDVKATFNLIGEQIEDGASIVSDAVAAGHQITSHSWNHPNLPELDAESLRAQLTDSFAAIKDAAGYDTTTIRAPYGSITFDVWLNSGGAMSLSCFWTHDSEDWKLPGVDAIVENCTVDMAPGSVILLHDGGGDRSQTIEALPQIIEAWKDAGYRFVTMEELMASDSSIPEECAATYRPMPEDAVWPTEKAQQASTTNVG